ncbi:alpha/beta fold hydrolase [Catenuloplanes japonicus]|uniref:alpha/beta fold hydrolase n=1 Tax=Catenuloplanes japonicus TaxID=33876 RepID=UPI00052578A1|nr:alpha/beta hydrolase [Catenuloplanes japonicus]
MEKIALSDGRTLEYLVEGPAGGRPLVFHHGTPAGGVLPRPLIDAAARHGLRLVMPNRPGYCGSTSHPGRRVADVAADVTALLDALGADDFVTVGWSGGGPHALACAALLPDRCRGAATIAGVAPFGAPGLDWLAGMGEDNLAEFGAAFRGDEPLDAFLTDAAAGLVNVGPDEVIAAFGDLLSDVDTRTLRAGMADYLAAASRAAVAEGIAGWREDDLAFVTDWGFRLDELRVPVAIWQGDQDRMVPFDHGRWLAAHVSGADAHLLPGEGHLSLLARADTIVGALS